MRECLGISISDKMIKYAKVQNDDKNFKVISYGIRFYEGLKLNSTIEQIIQETNSEKTPISMNVDSESYYYFNVFKMTNKDYINKAVQTEFESFCVDNHLNKDTFVGRYHVAKSLVNQDQNKIMYVYANKINLNSIKSYAGKYNLTSITPTAVALPNLLRINREKNIMIVDLNDNTKVTTIIGGNLYSVDVLKCGMNAAFDAINARENSYSKTYEVCKNTTIYTMESAGQSFSQTKNENDYLQFIVPELYKIVQEVKTITGHYERIDNIYLTGFGTVINNVDLYFQEYFQNTKVEILKPFFATNDGRINLKDYIEVNSAIALAIQGMDYGIQSLNFKSNDILKKIKDFLSQDVSSLSKKQGTTGGGGKTSIKDLFKNIKLPSLDSINKVGPNNANLIVNIVTIMIIIFIFCFASSFVTRQINKKVEEAQQTIAYTNKQKELANSDDSTIKNKTQDYIRYKTNLENTSSAIEKKRSRKNQITNLLSKIAYTIPKGVTLTEIKNTEQNSKGGTVEHITINAKASKYEQLAYFKAKIKNAEILENVTSTEGEKSGNDVTIVIEGDLASY